MSDGFTGGLLSKKDFPVCVPVGRNVREQANSAIFRSASGVSVADLYS